MLRNYDLNARCQRLIESVSKTWPSGLSESREYTRALVSKDDSVVR
jgi:hypothetical protein